MYKIEVGKLTGEHKRGVIRDFIPFVTEVVTEDELKSRLPLWVNGWKDRLLPAWLHSEERPRTFIIDSHHGYRITKVA